LQPYLHASSSIQNHLLLGVPAIQHLTILPWTGNQNSLKASKQVHLVCFVAAADVSVTCCAL